MNPIKIKTLVGDREVYTTYSLFNKRWVTSYYFEGDMVNYQMNDSLEEAARYHLNLAVSFKS